MNQVTINNNISIKNRQRISTASMLPTEPCRTPHLIRVAVDLTLHSIKIMDQEDVSLSTLILEMCQARV
jgi:hypothetical protein